MYLAVNSCLERYLSSLNSSIRINYLIGVNFLKRNGNVGGREVLALLAVHGRIAYFAAQDGVFSYIWSIRKR